MVGVMAGPDAPALDLSPDLRRWRLLTPLAAWTTINLTGSERTEILQGIAAALDSQGLPTRQLILLGAGIAARRALELVLQGALDCAGIVAIGIPCNALPFGVVPVAAAIRLVVHHEERQGKADDLIGALRIADVDARIVRLSQASAKDARAAAAAAEAFVLELVAMVGRHARHGVRSDDIQDS